VEWFRNFIFGNFGTCTYCGSDTGTSVDHVIPVNWFSKRGSRQTQQTGSGIRTWACLACNSGLGDKFFDTFSDRTFYVERFLRRRYSRTLSCEDWEPSEIAELSGKLKSYVLNAQKELELVRSMVEWRNSDGFYRNLEGLLYQPCLDPMDQKYSDLIAKYFEAELPLIGSLIIESNL